MELDQPPFDPQVRARTLLALLWRKYDAAGISMGRSHEAVLLETAMELFGEPDVNEIAKLDEPAGYGNVVEEARSWLSERRAIKLGFGAKP